MPVTQGRSVYRTARIALRPTRAQGKRLFGLLKSAGDVWAWLLDCNRQLRAWGDRPVVNYQALCRELTGVRFGELDVSGARSVLKQYSQAWFEAAARRGRGARTGFPRRKRSWMPVRYTSGSSFAIEGNRVFIPVAKGTPRLSVRLSREVPYSTEQVRSITLLYDAGRFVIDVTALVPVERTTGRATAGVDLGIVHPYAVVTGTDALLVSGRAIRAETRLHLSDTKRRMRNAPPKTPGNKRSRRRKQALRKQRMSEGAHGRRIRQAHHEAANAVVSWASDHEVGVLVVGAPKGLATVRRGKAHNLRLRDWRRAHLTRALKDKAERAGIDVVLVDERGTSSTCPECSARTAAPRGRTFACSNCGFAGHRDLVGARNIAARGGGVTCSPERVQHRRAGTVPARRDRRRHLMDAARSGPAPGRAQPKRLRKSFEGGDRTVGLPQTREDGPSGGGGSRGALAHLDRS